MGFGHSWVTQFSDAMIIFPLLNGSGLFMGADIPGQSNMTED